MNKDCHSANKSNTVGNLVSMKVNCNYNKKKMEQKQNSRAI